MGTASDLAAAVALVIPQGAVRDAAAGILGPTFGALDLLGQRLTGSSGIDRIAALLTPDADAVERTAAAAGERLIACLPTEATLLAPLQAADSLARSALNEVKQLWNPKPPGGSTAPGFLGPRASQALADAIRGVGAQGQGILDLHDTLSMMTADFMQVAVTGGGGWTASGARDSLIRQAKKWIEKIGNWGGTPEHTAAMAKELEFELTFRFPVRLAVAAVISAGAHVLFGARELMDDVRELTQGKPSAKGLGADVHTQLQQSYRQARLVDLIEQDDMVYGLSINSLSGRRLADVAFDGNHLELTALYLARQSQKPIDLSLAAQPAVKTMLTWSIRDDTTNFSDGCLFEIKPVRGAWMGVIQEMYYRGAFNLWMAVFQDFPSLPVKIASILGDTLQNPTAMCTRLRPGVAADWPEANSARRGVQRFVSNGNVYAVMTVSLDALPGLLLYWIFDLPVALLKLIYDELRDAFNKLANKVQNVVIEVFVWVTAIALATAAVLLLLALIASGEVLVAALLAALGELGVALSGAVAAGLLNFQQVLQRLSAGWTLAAIGDASSGTVRLRLDPQQALPADAMLTGIQIGHVRIERIPVDAAKHIGAVIQAGLAMSAVRGGAAPGVA